VDIPLLGMLTGRIISGGGEIDKILNPMPRELAMEKMRRMFFGDFLDLWRNVYRRCQFADDWTIRLGNTKVSGPSPIPPPRTNVVKILRYLSSSII
jgi:hypothetical protein